MPIFDITYTYTQSTNGPAAATPKYGSMEFGANVQGTQLNLATAGMALTVDNPRMAWELWDSGAVVLSGVFATGHPYNLVIDVDNTGASAIVNIKRDATPFVTNYLYSQGQFLNNYITMGSYGNVANAYTMAKFDNFTVSTVPEPSALVSLLSTSVLGGLALLRRRFV